MGNWFRIRLWYEAAEVIGLNLKYERVLLVSLEYKSDDLLPVFMICGE